MNLPLYSPSAPAARPVAGVGQVGALRPLPDVAEHLPRATAPPAHPAAAGAAAGLASKLPATGRSCAATSHSASVGRRVPAQRAIGVGLVVADVGDGARALDAAAGRRATWTRQPRRRAPPSRAAPASPRALTAAQPSESQSSGRAIAAVGHEVEPFAAGDQAIRQAEGLDERVVARHLVVEGKALAVVTDLANAAGEVDPASGLGRRLARRRLPLGDTPGARG